MRLSKLYLKAFGPYTEQVIDFGGTDALLHILYGPNEAGKSSLLRAIRDRAIQPRNGPGSGGDPEG